MREYYYIIFQKPERLFLTQKKKVKFLIIFRKFVLQKACNFGIITSVENAYWVM